MEIIREFDNRIKRELINKVDEVQFSQGIFFRVLAGVEQKRSYNYYFLGMKKYTLAAICVLFLIIGTTFTFSPDVRAVASGVVQSVRTVFVLNKDDQVVERPANQVFVTPACSLNTQLSDAELSKKIGLHFSFPPTINGDFNMQRKAEAVCFASPIDYETFINLQNKTEEAINNQDAFNSLKQYKPYHSVGAVYQNPSGLTVGLVIHESSVPLSTENMKITETMQTQVNYIDAKWIGLSYPDNSQQDLTQKPQGMISTHLLMWSANNATYEIIPINNTHLSMEQTLSLAEAFMNLQK